MAKNALFCKSTSIFCGRNCSPSKVAKCSGRVIISFCTASIEESAKVIVQAARNRLVLPGVMIGFPFSSLAASITASFEFAPAGA